MVESEDLLDRKQFVDNLYKQIIQYPFSDSFVYALYGKWGEGKTSIINLLKNKLEQNDNIIVYEFDPWYFPSQEALVERFYQGLYQSLNQRYFLPAYRKIFSKYQNFLSSGLNISGINVDLSRYKYTLEDSKSEIEKLIGLTGKKIIIIIDDIDRLKDKNEIHQMFQIVKLSSKFKNTIFLLSFDRHAIKEHIVDDEFLEKIIQAPIHMPSIDQFHIDKYLFFSYLEERHYSGIDRLFIKLQIDPDRIAQFDRDFTDFYQTKLFRVFPTLRCAKRYLNGLYQTLPQVKNEVHLQDFLILELIRIFYPDVYDDIWIHPWYYIPPWSDKFYISSPFHFSQDSNEKYSKIKEHISNLLQIQPEKEVLRELLEAIFPIEVKNAFSQSRGTNYDNISSTYLREKRITHPDNFPKYFTLKVPTTDLPTEVVENLISLWNSSTPIELDARFMEDLRKFQQEKKLMRLFDKFLIFLPRINSETAKNIIRLLYININFFSKEGRKDFWQSEYDKAELLMLRLINEKLAENEIEPCIIQIIQEAPSFDLAVGIVLSCRRERGGSLYRVYDNIRLDHIQQIISQKLAQHFIEEDRDIFEEEKERYSFILYQWGDYNQDDKNNVMDYVFKLIDRNPQYLGKIIKGYIMNWGKQEGKQIQYDELVGFYNEERLYGKIQENYLFSYSNPEEKEAIDLFLRTYTERISSSLERSERESRKAQFINLLNQGVDLFNQRQFSRALNTFNQTLSVTSWEEEHNLIAQAKYKKWQCLLELALNDKDEHRKNYFNESCLVAGNERQIQTLIDSVYNTGPADRAPIELYYCIFYFLQWDFAEEQQKSSIKNNFMIHYHLATTQNTSGWSAEIADRCNGYFEKMS